MKATTSKSKAFLLRINLLDIEPEIWRTFAVPALITLDRLSVVIQIVMDWDNSHLHEFRIKGKTYAQDAEELMEDGYEGVFEEGKFRLGDLIGRKGSKFSYLYDFGDCWMHEIRVLDTNFSSEECVQSIFCVGGERATPPEDCGGPFSYEDFCIALEDEEHPDHEELCDWCGGEFDSEFFDREEINKSLLKYIRRSKARF